MLLSSSVRPDTHTDPRLLPKPSVTMPASADLKKQFDAAVNVIRNLPVDSAAAKDALFQPSNELKLRFYACFKQATEGPNRTAKPAFYDIVGRYKWDAWTALADMSRDEAMQSYVNELKQIVETMSLTQPVADFYDVLGPFYEFAFPEKSVNNVNGSANASVAKTKIKNSGSAPKSNGINGSHARTSATGKVNGYTNGDTVETESDGDEFSDTYDHISEEKGPGFNGRRVSADEIISARGEAELTPPRFVSTSVARAASSRSQASRSARNAAVAGSDDSLLASGASGDDSDKPSRREAVPEVNEQIAFAILRLQQSMEHVEHRLHSLENQIRTNNSARDRQKEQSDQKVGRSWWPFDGLSPSTTLFLVMWPVVTHLVMERVRNQRSGK